MGSFFGDAPAAPVVPPAPPPPPSIDPTSLAQQQANEAAQNGRLAAGGQASNILDPDDLGGPGNRSAARTLLGGATA